MQKKLDESTRFSNCHGTKNPTMLTAPNLAARIAAAVNKSAGHEKPVSIDRTPHSIVDFLRLSFSAAFGRVYSVMAGCLDGLRAGRSLCAIFSHAIQPVAHAMRSISGGYFTLAKELTHA
jgi:hypothetical protein